MSIRRFIGTAVIVTWVVRGIGLIVILMLVLGGFSYCQTKGREAPDVSKAPWSIQTYTKSEKLGVIADIPSRIYFAENVVYNGDIPTITNYWKLVGDRFVYVKGDKPLEGYSKIDIKRR